MEFCGVIYKYIILIYIQFQLHIYAELRNNRVQLSVIFATKHALLGLVSFYHNLSP